MQHPIIPGQRVLASQYEVRTISDLIFSSGAKRTSGSRHSSGSTNPTLRPLKSLTKEDWKPSAGKASLASWLYITSVAAARSPTDLAIAHMLSKVEDPSHVPSKGIVPIVALIENNAARVAGWIHEPSVSVPRAMGL